MQILGRKYLKVGAFFPRNAIWAGSSRVKADHFLEGASESPPQHVAPIFQRQVKFVFRKEGVAKPGKAKRKHDFLLILLRQPNLSFKFWMIYFSMKKFSLQQKINDSLMIVIL